METKRLGIAIIDDGVNKGLYGLDSLSYDIEISPDLTISQRKNKDSNSPSHGTTCAAIIKKYAEDADLSSIKILGSKTKKATKRQLIAALEWCAEKNIRIVNLSIGTINFMDFEDIGRCINKVTQKGLVIVAACNNKNIYTCPASFSSVIGVRYNKNIFSDQHEFVAYPYDGIEILACSRHYLVDVFGNHQYTKYCNSYAAPVITAKIYNIIKIQSNITLENVMKEMANTAINANYIDYNPYFKLTIDWVKNAVLINTNSKIKLFDEFLYGLYIKKVITIPQNEYNSKELIENIILELHNIEQSGIDTDCFIINFSEDFEVPYDYRTQLIQCFSNLNKSTALLYKPEKFLNRTCISQEGITSVWDPTIYSAILSRQESKENILKIPVVAFFGTSYIEYSFIINNLNSLFRNDGYFSVGISNVCTDILYGMEYLPEWANIPNCLGSIYDKYECDVLLVGICHDMYEKNDIYNKNSINADIIITIEEVDGEGGIQIIAGDYNTIHIVFRYNIETISADISLLYKELINCFNSA